MEIKVLLLGHKGMLGHMVSKYLTNQGFKITTTELTTNVTTTVTDSL